jgi:hypothetical protein
LFVHSFIWCNRCVLTPVMQYSPSDICRCWVAGDKLQSEQLWRAKACMFTASVGGRCSTSIYIDVLYVLPVTILHKEVICVKGDWCGPKLVRIRMWPEMCRTRRVEFYKVCSRFNVGICCQKI